VGEGEKKKGKKGDFLDCTAEGGVNLAEKRGKTSSLAKKRAFRRLGDGGPKRGGGGEPSNTSVILGRKKKKKKSLQLRICRMRKKGGFSFRDDGVGGKGRGKKKWSLHPPVEKNEEKKKERGRGISRRPMTGKRGRNRKSVCPFGIPSSTRKRKKKRSRYRNGQRNCERKEKKPHAFF